MLEEKIKELKNNPKFRCWSVTKYDDCTEYFYDDFYAAVKYLDVSLFDIEWNERDQCFDACGEYYDPKAIGWIAPVIIED